MYLNDHNFQEFKAFLDNEGPINSAVPRRFPVAEALMKAIG